jgi:hypothetical protein
MRTCFGCCRDFAVALVAGNQSHLLRRRSKVVFILVGEARRMLLVAVPNQIFRLDIGIAERTGEEVVWRRPSQKSLEILPGHHLLGLSWLLLLSSPGSQVFRRMELVTVPEKVFGRHVGVTEGARVDVFWRFSAKSLLEVIPRDPLHSLLCRALLRLTLSHPRLFHFPQNLFCPFQGNSVLPDELLHSGVVCCRGVPIGADEDIHNQHRQCLLSLV